jgi:arylsulfatase
MGKGPAPVSLTSAAPSRWAFRAAAKGGNVLICVLDAARADHFGAYGYSRETTPNFDRLAKHGVIFEQHFCQYTQTTSSTASLFTSQYPDSHGLLLGRGVPRSPTFASLDPATFTLERGLQDAGFRTFLVTQNSAASPDFGVGADFQFVSTMKTRTRDESGLGPAKVGTARRDLESLFTVIAKQLLGARQRPFFGYVHILPPHEPYEAPAEFRSRFEGTKPPGYHEGVLPFPGLEQSRLGELAPVSGPDWVNKYDANLRWADWALGKLEQSLRRAGLLETTVLIVTSDHGEAFREHGYEFHMTCPYTEVTHIPLLIRFPGKNGAVGRVRAFTQTVDIAPTVLDLFGVGYPKGQMQGRSLLPLLTGEVDRVNDWVFTRTGGRQACYAVRDHQGALLLYEGGELRALYDLQRDPGMTRNVVAQKPMLAAELEQVFREFAECQTRPPLTFVNAQYQAKTYAPLPEKQLSEETRRQLRAFGYMK